MKNCLRFGAVMLLLLLLVTSSYGDWIPGSINELNNGDFENPPGSWGPWEHGAGLALAVDGPSHNWGVYCKDPTQSLLLRQVVDETLNPLWDPYMHQKEIDLMADIRTSWMPGDPGHPTSTVSFRLDWWSDVGKPDWWEPSQFWDGNQMVYVPGDFHSDWVTYGFTENGTWRTVNPFANDLYVLRDENGNPIQPRWVSVEVLIEQDPAEYVWVDNLILTSRCVVPEPSAFLGLGSGILGLCGMLRRRK